MLVASRTVLLPLDALRMRALVLRAQWWGKDSNLRRREPADLQSAPVGHLGTPPRIPSTRPRRVARLKHLRRGARPRDRADGGNRTHDLPLTRRLLCHLSYVS